MTRLKIGLNKRVTRRQTLCIEKLEARCTPANIVGLISDHIDHVVVGTEVRWEASFSEDTPVEYSFWMRGSNTEWSSVTPYSVDATWRWDTTTFQPDRYFVTAFVRELGSDTFFDFAATPVSIIVSNQPPIDTISIESLFGSILSVDSTATFVANLEQSPEGVDLQFRMRGEATDWVVVQEYSSLNYWNWDNLETGRYFVTAFARPRGTLIDWELFARPITVVVKAPLSLLNANIEASADRVVVGAVINFQVNHDPIDILEYAYRWRSTNSEWTTIRSFDSESRFVLDTTAVPVGTYFVGVFVRRQGSLRQYEALVTPVSISIFALPPVSNLQLSVLGSSRVLTGQNFQLEAHTDTSELVEFSFIRRNEHGDWETVRDFGTDPFFTWDTSQADVSIYYVTVLARRVGSIIPHEAIATPLTLVVADVAGASGVTFTMDWSMAARVGQPFRVSALAVGGSGNYEYRFRFRGAQDWRVMQAFSPSNIWNWIPEPVDVGMQYAEVCVHSYGSPVECEAVRVIGINVRESADQMWDRFYADYVSQPLWNGVFVEDASHTLHVPLAAAFQEPERTQWRQVFADHFRAFVDSGASIDVQLYRLEYYYLASRFVGLSEQAGQSELIPPGLVEKLREEVHRLWTEEPAWMWDSPSFPGGIKERIQWKLNVIDPPYRYYAAMVDHDLFFFGIAAEIAAYDRMRGAPTDPVLVDISQMTRTVLEHRIEWNQHGGWLFQQGLWSDHPEYAHSGHSSVQPDLPPLAVDDLAEDSSHSMRWPLWLKSFEAAAVGDEAATNFYQQLRAGLNQQFTSRVLVTPSADFDGYRLRNYMNGYNGIYRYQYYTAGEGRGFDPYELSGALMIGMWGFLESTAVNQAYKDLASRFPVDNGNLETYIGANTSRVRHPLEVSPAAYHNGNYEFLLLLASQLPTTQ